MLRNLLRVSPRAKLTGFAVKRAASTYTLPDLPYDYNALEPVISPDIMKIHHSKHHQAYVTGFNTTLEKLDAATDPATIVSLQSLLKFNGGGELILRRISLPFLHSDQLSAKLSLLECGAGLNQSNHS